MRHAFLRGKKVDWADVVSKKEIQKNQIFPSHFSSPPNENRAFFVMAATCRYFLNCHKIKTIREFGANKCSHSLNKQDFQIIIISSNDIFALFNSQLCSFSVLLSHTLHSLISIQLFSKTFLYVDDGP